MDIVVTGTPSADRRPPAWPRYLIGLLVVAVAAVAWLSRARPSQPAPSTAMVRVVAGLVETGTGISYETSDAAKDFVVRVDLKNFNHLPVHVRAETAPDHAGFERLAAAVLPGAAEMQTRGYDAVEAASYASVPLDGDAQAALVVAGRVDCAAGPAGDGKVTLQVDDQRTTVTLPRVGDQTWVTAVRNQLCRRGR
ncbi:hypothetical protein ACQP2F_29580 [Actinoplanes sp. CA-030573]|uniref:hypothetical protein n=1 Tax=Actinoplanes sp. CA-030573 TaxID=3239898 RepID=UPI003D91CCE2